MRPTQPQKAMPTRLAIRIQDSLDTLTPSERHLASYILENQHLVVGLSAAELAREAGTSKSTTVRFFRTLGYESFDAVRQQAREELNRLQPGADRVVGPLLTRPGSAEAFLAGEITAIARTHEGLNSETARLVVDRLAAAERVWIAAFGEDAPLAPLIDSQLSAIRPNVALVAEGSNSIFSKLASFGPRDTLLLLALGERLPETRFAVEQARSAGCSVLAILGLTTAAPIGSDVVLRCHANSDASGGSVTAAVSLVHFLTRQLAARLGDRATSRAAMIETVREAMRGRS